MTLLVESFDVSTTATPHVAFSARRTSVRTVRNNYVCSILLSVEVVWRQVSGSLLNTGRDLRVILDEPSLGHSVNITGGPLSYQYRITEIILHFGSISSLGSEHTIAGVSFPAEVCLSVSACHWPCPRAELSLHSRLC